jgi:dihydrofolate synthase/folylpolyglutamate synthase
MDPWDRYARACHYINEGLIRTDAAAEPDPRTRRQWMEGFLPRLGHPERSFPAVHVAGTSGKGSVAAMIAEMLREAHVRAGLHISPYLQVATEKLWVDGRYASADELAALVDWIQPHAEACRGPQVPMHGMASVAIALEHLRRSQVEIGVMETGVGGREDLTNVLRTRVAVITAVGLDHVKTLGPDLESIARHKAGIIRGRCRAVVLEGPAVAPAVEQARAEGAQLRILPSASFDGQLAPDGRTLLDFAGTRYRLRGVPLAMRGPFQAENAALAVAALEELADDGLELPEGAVRAGLGRARLPGRLELIPASSRNVCPVLLDGAHNPDKLAALLTGLGPLRRRRLHVVFGALATRSPGVELERLAGLSHTLVLTEPRVYQKSALPCAELARHLAATGCHPVALPLPDDALDAALAAAAPDDLVLVTGSLYLCGELRERWHPAREVLLQRQSWPAQRQ